MTNTPFKNITSGRYYQLWRKAMFLGERTGCHQKPERSFFIHGYQLPVCARCSGVIIGYLLAIITYFMNGFYCLLSILGCICMLVDWLIQACKIKNSTNKRRFITGILGGFGIMSIQIHVIKKLISLFIKMYH